MKNLLCLILLVLFISSLKAQDSIPRQKKETENAIVYLVRVSPLAPLINFRIFVDGDYVGKFHNGQYLKLYVKPGRHVISAKAENLYVMEAQLESGKVYLIETAVQAGAFYAAVHLDPVSMKNERQFTRIQKRIAKSKIRTFNEAELKKKTEGFKEIIYKASHKYYRKKKKGKAIHVLNEPIDEDLLWEYRNKETIEED
ncbi:hypothetical protein ACJD0Z_17465 [Flavobacteriaceae bacterium M23B6Z8]